MKAIRDKNMNNINLIVSPEDLKKLLDGRKLTVYIPYKDSKIHNKIKFSVYAKAK